MTTDVKIMFGISLATTIVFIGGILLVGNQSSNQPAEKTEVNTLVRDDSNKIATDSAKVTIVEFGDFQCPACAAVVPAVKQALQEYEGNLTFVFRNFPLTTHRNAEIAAEAAEAAGEQGKYWEMYDRLYAFQSDWSESDKPLDIFVAYAQALELDTEKFRQAVESKKFRNKIQQDTSDGIAAGVNATPTFFINGEKLPGALSFEQFKAKIDPKLPN